MISEELLQADRDQAFSDWGESIVLRAIDQEFDPLTQQITETISEQMLTAIVSDVSHHALPPTANQAFDTGMCFFVKAEDLSQEPPQTNCRIVWQSREFLLAECRQTADGLVWVLVCREQG